MDPKEGPCLTYQVVTSFIYSIVAPDPKDLSNFPDVVKNGYFFNDVCPVSVSTEDKRDKNGVLIGGPPKQI
jgi:hypothetical protein